MFEGMDVSAMGSADSASAETADELVNKIVAHRHDDRDNSKRQATSNVKASLEPTTNQSNTDLDDDDLKLVICSSISSSGSSSPIKRSQRLKGIEEATQEKVISCNG